jgi:hypothetical protein
MTEAANTVITSTDAGGAYVENLYVRRKVTVLAVHEHEVDDIAFMNTLSTACFSLCSASVAFAVGILTNAAFAEKLTATALGALQIGVPLCVVTALVFAVGGFIALRRKDSTLGKIRRQSESA